MSEFHVSVVRLGPVTKHPNADSLDVTLVHGGYPVICRSGTFKEGDLAVYVPVDALVPTSRPEFAFLGSGGMQRIRAKRLRGVFSMGLLVPIDPEWLLGPIVEGRLQRVLLPQQWTPVDPEWLLGPIVEGDDLRAALGIEKWEPAVDLSTRGLSEGDPPGNKIPVYDLEGLRRLKHLLVPGEEIVITEKLHGCNARFFYDANRLRLWVGSRTNWKREEGDNLWWPVATSLADSLVDLYYSHPSAPPRSARRVFQSSTPEEIARDMPDSYPLGKWVATDMPDSYVLYGEVYGQVQDLKYDQKAATFRAFDIFDRQTMSFVDSDTFFDLCKRCNILTVPALYRGPWDESLMKLAEGQSTLAGHVREGFVVRPVNERRDLRHGRVVLKMIGEGYLTRKEKQQ